jgi:hypothetical protein
MIQQRLVALSAAVALAACTQACTHVPLGSILPLTRIKFGTTDIALVRAAVKLPDSLRPRAGGVRMTVILGLSGEPPRSQKFALIESHDPEDQAALAAFASVGFVVYAYRLAPDDVARLERMRADMIEQAAALKQEGKNPGSNLTIKIGAEEVCHARDLGSEPLLTTSYIKTSETGQYVTALRDVDLRLEPAVKDKIDTMPPC